MSLSPGTRIGVFEIGSPIGAGGMGEVYLATDTKLNRQVAIKILPEAVAHDAQRLARFRREAELLAALNHPNIATVFGIEETAAGMAMVMELVEGTDLRDRLARSTPGIAESLNIARQLADGIGAAHGRGIVHRDLKPSNICLRPDGMVKILDFGLARSVDPAADHETVTVTQPGTILGTPRYMSPEQARGENAGAQSDIWAFGAILYEMLTGTAAFDGGSSAETIAKVLTAEPDVARLPADVPASIALLLQRCLRKDLRRRLHHIGDAAIELEDALAPAGDERRRGTRRSHQPVAVAAIALAILAVVAIAGWLTRSQPSADAIVRADVLVPDRIGGSPFGNRRVAISSDGSRIAVATGSGLRVKRIDEEDFTLAAAGGLNPFFSPDGQSVAYFHGGESDSGLNRIGITGGSQTLIAPLTERTYGGDWRADGTIVFATASGLFLVREDGAQLRSVARPDATAGQRTYAWPQFLPGTNALQFTILPNGPISGAQIAVLDLDTSQVDVIVNGGSAARYHPSGHLFYASGNQLRRLAFDPRRRQNRGDEAIAIDGIRLTVAPDNGAADFAVADSGTLLFLAAGAVGAVPLNLVWIDRNGGEEPIDVPPGRYAYPRVSPDGSHVAMDVLGTGRDIWVYDLARRSLSQLSFGPTEDMMPAWSRDGQRVFWASDRSGNFDIYSRAADGATPERVEFAGSKMEAPSSFSPDGSRLFVIEDYRDVGVLTGPPFQRIEPVLHSTPASERLAELSPDGKWLAYESNETGVTEVFVRPFPDVDARREKVSRAGGRYPVWNPDGNGELFYVTPEGHMMAAAIAFSTAPFVRSEKKLFEGPPPPQGISGRPYDFSRKHGRFLVTRRAQNAAPGETRLTLIVNWASHLARP